MDNRVKQVRQAFAVVKLSSGFRGILAKYNKYFYRHKWKTYDYQTIKLGHGYCKHFGKPLAMNFTFQDDLKFDIRAVDAGSLVPLHKGQLFKLVFILEGTGIHQISRTNLSFQQGDIFIVSPGEEFHSLKTETPLEFLVIVFSSLFLGSSKSDGKQNSELLGLLQYANLNPDYILELRNKCLLTHQLIKTLMSEISNEGHYKKGYVCQLVYTLLLIVGEKVKISYTEDDNLFIDKRIADMLYYIHQNICNPEKLTTTELSRRFFLSPVYIGKYFKNNTNQSLHQYIMRYKIKLIESRLSKSDMRVSEIADEFGFSDKSYLNKFFIKLNGVTPMTYRRNTRHDQGLKPEFRI